MSDIKHTMRIEARRARDLIDPKNDNPEDAVVHFFTAPNPQITQTIAAYWPKGREFDPRPILDECLKKGHICALPMVEEGTRILKFVQWDESIALEEGPYGIKQPVIDDDTQYIEPDIILVPMLAFDQKGNRLGQGGGYYDATLSDLRARKDIQAIGVAYAQQACLFKLPTEGHDQKLDMIITPRTALRF